MTGRNDGGRFAAQESGRRFAKETAKAKSRRSERDRDYDMVRKYNAGCRDEVEDDG